MAGSKSYRKKGYYSKSKKPKDKTVSHKIELVDKKVKKLQKDVELKEYPTTSSYHDINNQMQTFYLLNDIPGGSSEFQRTGNRVRCTSLRITGEIERSENSTVPNTVRMLVLWDSQPNGADPPLTDVNFGLFNEPANTSSMWQLATYNLDNQQRYKVLLDKRMVLNANFVRVDNKVFPTRHLFNHYIKLSRDTIYVDSGSTIESITKNALYVVFCSDIAPSFVPDPNTQPIVRYSSNLYYKDA